MTFTKVVGWLLVALSACGLAYMIWIFGWLLLDPRIDPLPVVLPMFFRLAPLLVDPADGHLLRHLQDRAGVAAKRQAPRRLGFS